MVDKNKILLVRMSSMGDLIHTLPAIQDLSQHRPDIELHWLAEKSFADIARLHPFVKQVHEISWRQWRKNLFQSDTRKAMSALKSVLSKEGFALTLDSQGLLKSAWFARWAAAPIAGLDRHSAREPLAAWFYQYRFAVAKNHNAVWRNRQLFAQAFKYDFDDKVVSFGLTVPDDAAIPNLPTCYHVALHATSKDSKLWSEAYWQEWFALMRKHDNLPILLPWGNASEKQRAEQLAKNSDGVLVCPALTLKQAAWLLKHAQSVVGVDTGLLHLANALDCPVVGIYVDTDPLKTGVQTSPWAANLGNVGQAPTPVMVYEKILACIEAKDAVKN